MNSFRELKNAKKKQPTLTNVDCSYLEEERKGFGFKDYPKKSAYQAIHNKPLENIITHHV